MYAPYAMNPPIEAKRIAPAPRAAGPLPSGSILGPDLSHRGRMKTWTEFRDARPDLAEAGRGLFYQWNVGLGFLSTVRKDGGPRCHPMCPVITDDGLFALIEPDGPKRYDLERDGRYALHCF